MQRPYTITRTQQHCLKGEGVNYNSSRLKGEGVKYNSSRLKGEGVKYNSSRLLSINLS